ncbi:MAG: hypothetical protein ACI3YC_08610, partial [Alloprevotella sp.]
YNDNVKDWNNSLNINEEMFIRIPWECFDEYITHIIVSKEDEIDDMINHIMDQDKLLGFDNEMDYSRMKLISKITSFERIENNY